jgi:hypothetical protein
VAAATVLQQSQAQPTHAQFSPQPSSHAHTTQAQLSPQQQPAVADTLPVEISPRTEANRILKIDMVTLQDRMM